MPQRAPYASENARSGTGEPASDYIETTRTFWQPYAGRELTREDAREMAHNLLGFFAVLREWTIRERERERLGIAAPMPAPVRKGGRSRTKSAIKSKMPC